MAFRFLDHTADIAVEINAASREELFAEALAAFTETLTVRQQVEAAASRDFTLAATAWDLLLVDWLSELLYAFEVEEWLFRRAEVRLGEIDGEMRLTARAHGERRDPDRHPLKILIKAVTYHALEVTEGPAGFRARVIFDI